MEIASLDEFLGYAVKVEEDAAIHFDGLANAMEEVGNAEVARLFRQLAGFSRLHLAEAQARCGSVQGDLVVPPDYVWPDHATPERTSLMAGDATLTRLDALKAALQGEKRGHEFYLSVVARTSDAAIADMARLFVKEEAEHVKILEAWITREQWANANPATETAV